MIEITCGDLVGIPGRTMIRFKNTENGREFNIELVKNRTETVPYPSASLKAEDFKKMLETLELSGENENG
jgi:hypothetical protein